MLRLHLYHHHTGAQHLEDILTEIEDQRGKLDRLRAGQELIMADLTRLNAAIATVIAYINTLKSTPPPEDPAVQAGVDAAAAALESQLPPSSPPA